MMKEQTNELVKKESTEIEEFDDSLFDQLEPDQDSPESIVLPNMLIMQAGTPKVKDKTREEGELADNQNWKVFASMATSEKKAVSLEFLPFKWELDWKIQKNIGTKWAPYDSFKVTPQNKDDNQYETWKEKDRDGNMAEFRRVKTHVYWGLIEGEPLPFKLSFKNYSFNAGSAIYTQLRTINKMLKVKKGDEYKRTMVGTIIEVTPVRFSKNGNEWVIMEAKKLRETTRAEAQLACKWAITLKDQKTSGYSDSEEEEIIEGGSGGHHPSTNSQAGEIPSNIDF